MDELKKYDVVIRGFDVHLYDSPDNAEYYRCEISERGNLVYTIDIPLLEGEELGSDDSVNRSASSAIDLFEAERGTLGQGAGAMSTKQSSAKKESFYGYNIRSYEEWFMELKNSPYESQATMLIEELSENQKKKNECDQIIQDLQNESARIMEQLEQLDIDRMKSTDDYKSNIIVIKAKRACMCLSEVKSFLDMFKGHQLEPMAVGKMKEYLENEKKITEMYNSREDLYRQSAETEDAMKELYVLNKERKFSDGIGENVIAQNPNMANDIAELMQGIDLNSPIQPTASRKQARELTEEQVNILRKLRDAGGALQFEKTKISEEDMGILQAEGLVRLENHASPFEHEDREKFFFYTLTDQGENSIQTKRSKKAQFEEEELLSKADYIITEGEKIRSAIEKKHWMNASRRAQLVSEMALEYAEYADAQPTVKVV